MKVLHCLAQLPTRTGSGVYFNNLIKSLDELTDWQQAALYALPGGQASCKEDLIGAYCTNWQACSEHFPIIFDSENLPFHIVGMSDEMPYKSTRYCDMNPEMLTSWLHNFGQELLKIKESFRPDIIISHHLWILTSLVLDLFPNTPIIAISHGTDIRQAKQNPEIAEKYVGSLSALSKVTALSELQLADIEDCFDIKSDQIVVTGGAYDSEIFYADPDIWVKESDKQFRLLYAGKMSEAKGVYELLDAFSLAYEKDKNLNLDLVGIADQKLQDHLRLAKYPQEAINLFDVESQKELAQHMRKCDAFVFPSYYEGLGLIAIEALASGLALISNKLPALWHQVNPFVGESKLIKWIELPRLDNLDEPYEEDIADYVERLSKAMLDISQAKVEMMANKKDCSASNAYFAERLKLSSEVEIFSWNNLAEKIIEIVEEVVN